MLCPILNLAITSYGYNAPPCMKRARTKGALQMGFHLLTVSRTVVLEHPLVSLTAFISWYVFSMVL